MENPKIKELINIVSEYIPDNEINLIHRAFEFSFKAHNDQIRKSGEPYINHPIEVSKILASIKLDSSSIISGLLHDTIEDTKISLSEVKQNFGIEIADLVDGLTKINKYSLKVNNLKLGENYRKLLLAATKDLRVILIKLADRMHNMKTLNYIEDHHKQIRISLETLEIYAPLAQRLGMRDWQDQLEDLSFKYVNPEARNSIIERLDSLNSKDQNMIDEIRYELKKIFLEENIEISIFGRIKSPYSIWNKIKRKEISFEQLSDIMAFRVLTNSTRECYRLLGIIHKKFPYIHGRFKDFISSPKNNGYRALHTSVIGPFNKKIEIQIRSNVMDRIAEFGVAAHWKYKNPKQIKDSDSKEYKWMHDLLDLMNQSTNQDELIENSKIKLFDDNIYIFSPKGDVIELPKKSTPIDFAYSIHSEIGDKCVGAKINGNLQPLKSILRNGDQVEILTSNESQPSPLWERFVATSRVKSQIRKFMRSKKRDEHISFGKDILINAFKNEDIEYSDSALKNIFNKFNCKNTDDVYELVGSGSVTASNILKSIFPELKINYSKEKKLSSKSSIKLKGLTAGMTYHLAGCCSPLIGDNIVGIVTAGIGVSVHTIDCEILTSYSDSPERWLNVSWDKKNNLTHKLIARINVVLVNQPGSLGKVTTIIAKNNGNISNINFSTRKTDFFEIIIDIEVRDTNHLNNIIAALRLISEVSSLNRIKG
jgi:GTP diphosphokinase / guanosine-3',5'-bis(diphosphate) 3'-diphosphatase